MSVAVQVFHHPSFDIVKNSLLAISTKVGLAFVHSETASIVIILSLFTDFDFICHSSDRSSLHIQKISFIYVQAVVVSHILVDQSEAI
ncbi:hypothetical protein HOF65_00450 [bacterium]|nr:hypothetical protein [bacterium]MBT3852519.1 hypothetical protein [bacterium]MBT4632684.1 hypothetical protein [bacterium]MBT5492089.1 hypothetical protein [bacterium]MBT6778295.1 hypothetical protein [bacterium]